MSSMGYVMMNWSSEFLKQAKKKKRVEMRKKKRDEDEKEAEEDRQRKEEVEEERRSNQEQKGNISVNPLCFGINRKIMLAALDSYVARVSDLELELSALRAHQEEVKKKLEASKSSVASTVQRENKLR
jgi:hypothetical protein